MRVSDRSLDWLEGDDSAVLSHGELEDQLECRGRELRRRLLQDHLTLRATTEARLAAVADDAGVVHARVEPGHRRVLASVFGQVNGQRLAYRHRGHRNLHPADGLLNLPLQRYSHGLRRLAAIESSRGSFEQAAAAITRATGQQVGKRQVEALTARAAADVQDFYTTRPDTEPAEGDVLVRSADGKGIVMRPDSLPAATAKAAAAATTKLATRLSKGEKRNRKRMAEVGAVYDLTPVPRCPAHVLASDKHQPDPNPPPAPKAKNKWVTASVVDDAAAVIGAIFDQAERRDPAMHAPGWPRSTATTTRSSGSAPRPAPEASRSPFSSIWSTSWSTSGAPRGASSPKADPGAEAWMRQRALAILHGHAREVAAGIRRRPTAELAKAKRRNAHQCAKYLINKARYLDYPSALAAGWPIATGIIEGACRYLVADRMDITGARWSVDGAEAVLKLRAVRTNGDFDAYWRFHLKRERQRVHESRYANNVIPRAA